MPDEFREAGGSLPAVGDLNGDISSALCAPATPPQPMTILDTGSRSGDDDEDRKKPDYCERTYTGGEQSSQQSEIIISDFASSDSQCAYYRDRNVIVRPLTTDLSSLVSQLQVMRPIRLTNIALALEKGWHLLTPNAPYSEGQGPDDGLARAIVLLTDGRQTVGGFGPSGSFGISVADDNTEQLCARINEQDIILITVAYDLRDTATRNRLRDCASDPDYFFEAETNADLVTTFQSITAIFQDSVRRSR